MLAKNEHVNQMLDWYEKLLTDKQILVMNLYYREDLSLTEIAENLKISRSAVYDQIKRTVKLLSNYEDKLNLIKKYQQRQQLYQKLLESDANKTETIVKRLIAIE
ncbi:MAG: sigma factor-like helix-turn-helix DNA-binding protein [Erysipelotrichaceae bacterium]|nr:sigma factor-like helix-turn-helix DNA-binding protein [Erysipelotrichaceae bacterium]